MTNEGEYRIATIPEWSDIQRYVGPTSYKFTFHLHPTFASVQPCLHHPRLLPSINPRRWHALMLPIGKDPKGGPYVSRTLSPGR